MPDTKGYSPLYSSLKIWLRPSLFTLISIYFDDINCFCNRITIIENKIILQLHQSGIKVEEPYITSDTLKIENCLFCRFNDTQDNLQYAISKITLFAYENDIKLTNESYIVLIENKDNILLADVFMPIKKED